MNKKSVRGHIIWWWRQYRKRDRVCIIN